MIITLEGADFSANNVGQYTPMRYGMPSDGLQALYLMRDGVNDQPYPDLLIDHSGRANHAPKLAGYDAGKQVAGGIECDGPNGSLWVTPIAVAGQQTQIIIAKASTEMAVQSQNVGVNFSAVLTQPTFGGSFDSNPANANPVGGYPVLSQYRGSATAVGGNSAVNAFLDPSLRGGGGNINAGSAPYGSVFAAALAVDLDTGLLRTVSQRSASAAEATHTAFAGYADGKNFGTHLVGVYPNGSEYRPAGIDSVGTIYLHAIYDYVMTVDQMRLHIADAQAIVAARGVSFA